MYWYIKYPLIVILVLAALGLRGYIWRSCVRALPKGEPTPSELEVSPVREAAPAVSAPNPAKPDAVAIRPPAPAVSAPAGFSVDAEVDEQLAKARLQQNRGMLEVARHMAQMVLKSPRVVEFDPNWTKTVRLIDQINKALMNSTAPAPEKLGYRVLRGDSLARVASRHYTSIGALLRINESLRRDDGRDPIIRPTQTILYISGKWSILVSKQHYLLLLYLDDQLYRCWTVGIGRENRTPAGKFLITAAQSNPAWSYRGRIIPFGDPENVLGTRWLKLTPTDGTDPSLEGYGIHGTWEPGTVGTSCSSGCVRMRNEDVEELFDFIPVPGGSTPPVRVAIVE